jgi:hypothetical protein
MANDAWFPPGATEVRKRFEVCALCSQGSQQGQFLGKVLWRWSRSRGGVAAVDSIVTSREQPSPMFREALGKWGAIRGWEQPQIKVPESGGNQCQ